MSAQPTSGAPASLQVQAERLAWQDKKILVVRALERQAKTVVNDLQSDREVERQSVILGRAFLKLGCMLLVNGITRDDLL